MTEPNDKANKRRTPRSAEVRAEQKKAATPKLVTPPPPVAELLPVKGIVGKFLNFLTKLSPKK